MPNSTSGLDLYRSAQNNNPGYGPPQSISFGGPNPTNKIPGVNWPISPEPTAPGVGFLPPGQSGGSLAGDTLFNFQAPPGTVPYQPPPGSTHVPVYSSPLGNYGPRATPPGQGFATGQSPYSFQGDTLNFSDPGQGTMNTNYQNQYLSPLLGFYGSPSGGTGQFYQY